jgi:diadenosine tetraphosphate (Ap4A) HIT family hydrolase
MNIEPISFREAVDQGIAPWSPEDLIEITSGCLIYRDKFPVTPGHLLFVPNSSHHHMIELTLHQAYTYGIQMVQKNECDGFNVGINQGVSAGQTIMYPHVHLIPRRFGDCADPTGGVRNVIPGAGNYLKKNK